MVNCKGIDGSDLVACIGGFSGVPIKDPDGLLKRLASTSNVVVQLFDARRVAGSEHIFFAAVDAVRAFESGSAASRSLGMEVLLYASCQDQISKALGIIGVSKGAHDVCMLVMARDGEEARIAFKDASELLGSADDSVLDIDDEKFTTLKEIYRVTDVELEAMGGRESLPDLIIERCALLAIRR